MRTWQCASHRRPAFLLETALSQPTGTSPSYGKLNPDLTTAGFPGHLTQWQRHTRAVCLCLTSGGPNVRLPSGNLCAANKKRCPMPTTVRVTCP